MAVRNSRPRTQTNHIFVEHKGQRYMIQTGRFQTKDAVYVIKRKLLADKLQVPLIHNPHLKTVLITCNEDALNFELL